ncbi:MAG: ribbon-helix-helix domain-containing protein [Desulfobacteraceae bacterium]
MSKKPEVITFKVDEELAEAIRHIPNRSQFIRAAILSAPGTICPLCNGAGALTPAQKRHWESFAETHSVERCTTCDERFPVCTNAHLSNGSH